MSLALWVLVVAAWALGSAANGWIAFCRAHTVYNFILVDGSLVVQRAESDYLRYPTGFPAHWVFVHGQCQGAHYGPEPSTSIFDNLGLVNTNIRIPCEVSPGMGPNVIAESMRAAGRSVTVPNWMLVVLLAYPPSHWIIRRLHERREKRLRGFPVPLLA